MTYGQKEKQEKKKKSKDSNTLMQHFAKDKPC